MGSFARTALVSALIVTCASLVVACDDDDSARSDQVSPGAATKTGEGPRPDGPTATLDPQAVATLVAALQDAPVISDTPEPGWQAEGEPGAKLIDVCQPPPNSAPFANQTSLLMRGPNGLSARSATTIFPDQSDALPYVEALIADGASCASRLAQSWLDQAVTFNPGTATGGVGSESLLVTAAGGSGAAIFFRNEVAVAVLVVSGTGSEEAARELASSLEQQVIAKLDALSSGS